MIAAIEPTWYLIVASLLFGIGAFGLLVRRNPLVMFMCIELMLNAANLTFVALATALGDINGQTAVFFVMVVAAAEVVVGLGILVSILRRRPGCDRRRSRRVEGLTMADLVWLIPAFPLLGFLTSWWLRAPARRAARRLLRHRDGRSRRGSSPS